MTLGIAIPTHKNHLVYLEDILEILQNSTVKPSQVSISCSDFDDDYNINKLNYDFEIILTTFKESKNASQNRNIAASKLTTDIISFIDCDDFPHIQRNEFILKSFQNDMVKALVHNYHKSVGKNTDFIYSKYDEMDLKVDYCDIVIDTCATNRLRHLTLHNAHVSIRKEIFEKIKFDEGLIVGEDTWFTKCLVEGGYFLSLITNKLSQYNK